MRYKVGDMAQAKKCPNPECKAEPATELGTDYKNIQHHLKVLEGNNLVKKIEKQREGELVKSSK